MLGADVVREARKRAGLTQRELAGRAGTTQSAIARLESGRTGPSFELVRRLVGLCGYRLGVFLSPADDSDLLQAQRLTGMTPQERLDDLVSAVEALRVLRERAGVAGQV